MTKRPIRISNSLSLATAHICMARRQDQGELVGGATGTGFFWSHDDQLDLITNWHNVTGWDRVNKKALSENAFTPNVLVVEAAIGAMRDGAQAFGWRKVEIDLFDITGRPRWREHPSFGQKVDVVAINCPIQSVELATAPFNQQDQLLDFDPDVGDEVFALGYPRGLSGGAALPIWKRGSIASEPDFDLDDLPKVLIDTATREGMSGSPVVSVRTGVTRLRGDTAPPGGGMSGNEIIGTAMTFLGVYSGRVGDSALGAQLGIVWKAHVVNEIVTSGSPGSTPHE